MDGNLDDWKDVPGVTVVAKAQKAEPTELLRRPWLEIKDAEPQGNFAAVQAGVGRELPVRGRAGE